MGVGPGTHDRDERRDERRQHLFDRIASQIEGTASAFPADEAAEAIRRHDLGSTATDPETSGRSGSADDDSEPGGVLLERTGAWPAPDVSTQIERPAIANRQCSRTGCSDVAAVTLTYDYRQSQVWIDRLTPERDPHHYDMCDRHAEHLSVPRGWHLDDRRGARRDNLIAV